MPHFNFPPSLAGLQNSGSEKEEAKFRSMATALLSGGHGHEVVGYSVGLLHESQDAGEGSPCPEFRQTGWGAQGAVCPPC